MFQGAGHGAGGWGGGVGDSSLLLPPPPACGDRQSSLEPARMRIPGASNWLSLGCGALHSCLGNRAAPLHSADRLPPHPTPPPAPQEDQVPPERPSPSPKLGSSDLMAGAFIRVAISPTQAASTLSPRHPYPVSRPPPLHSSECDDSRESLSAPCSLCPRH
nr:splicing factor, proline- and glutamine-rich-like [Peromyscus maniculatus bairdii]